MVYLMTRMATKWLTEGRFHSAETLDTGRVRVLGGMEREDARFRHAAQNSMPLKTYERFTSGIFHFVFVLDHG